MDVQERLDTPPSIAAIGRRPTATRMATGDSVQERLINWGHAICDVLVGCWNGA